MSAPIGTVHRAVPADPQPDLVGPAMVPPRHRRTVLLAFVVTVVVALVSAGILETPLWWHEINPVLAALAVLSKPLDVLIVWLVLLLVLALTNRLWLSIGIVVLLSALLSLINIAKLSILTEPLFPNDTQFLNTPAFLISMVSPVQVALALIAIPVVIGLFVFLGRRLSRRYPRITRRESPRLWTGIAVVRLLVIVLVASALTHAAHFNEPGNRWRQLYDADGANWLPFSQAMNYRTNGFVGGLLYNMPSNAMRVPQGYSAETMSQVADRYAERAAVRNLDRSAGALDDVNVVLVLSESLADPGLFEGLELERDPLQSTRENIGDAWGGNALANYYGTGTSSMEFQALTGQTLALFNPQVISPYQNFMPDLDSYPSAVGWFRERGHRAVALHPYTTEMYRRKTIYPMLGFDAFVHDASMSEQGKLEHGRYISDYSAFAEVQHLIEENDQPLLVNLVTMQNHVPTEHAYSSPMQISGEVSLQDRISIGSFARGMEYSDDALDDFLDQIAESDEETVVVYYGDHYPAIFSQHLLDLNPGLGRLQTPLLIWSNQGQEPRPLPLTSANQFMPYVFDLVGEPLPPYYELLSEVAEKVGALGPGRIVSPEGIEISRDSLTEEQEQLLHDYELVQYDFSIGERYAVDDMWYPFD